MENYTPGEIKEISEAPPFQDKSQLIIMKVNQGSKIRNLMGYALAKIKDDNIREICWHGDGDAISKTITCAEIMKRKLKKLHQITKTRYKKVEEYWEPKLEGLERLRVNKNTPEIFILLSKDALDSSEPGYQAPGSLDSFWNEVPTSAKKQNTHRRRRYQNTRPSDCDMKSLAPGKNKSKKVKPNARSGQKAVNKAASLDTDIKKITSEMKPDH